MVATELREQSYGTRVIPCQDHGNGNFPCKGSSVPFLWSTPLGTLKASSHGQ